ncbi:MAG: Hsp20 family protein [Gammaproteobacteria bacterium]|nr:Hsp20 family protein [Gammaproteobacteria bacterium]
MNKRLLTGITVGAVLLIGSVSADAYYRHELAERVAARNVATTSAGPLTGSALSATPISPSAANDPFAAMTAQMARMQAQMDKMFNTAFQNPGGMDFVDGQGSAQVSLSEKDKDYVVTAKIPGSKQGDINVRLSGRLLTLSSKEEGSNRKTANNGQLTQQDQYASSFQQAFTLPGPVNASEMTSTFKDGVLTLIIPKA